MFSVDNSIINSYNNSIKKDLVSFKGSNLKSKTLIISFKLYNNDTIVSINHNKVITKILLFLPKNLLITAKLLSNFINNFYKFFNSSLFINYLSLFYNYYINISFYKNNLKIDFLLFKYLLLLSNLNNKINFSISDLNNLRKYFSQNNSNLVDQYFFNNILLKLQFQWVTLYKKLFYSYKSINKPVLSNDLSWEDKSINFNLFIFKLINRILKKGKRSVALKNFLSLVYFHKLNNLLTNKNNIFGEVFDVISPKFKLINIKVRGRNRQVPKLITQRKAINLGISFFVNSISSRKEKGLVLKMFNEVLDIYSLKGNSFKLKELNYKQGISNRFLLFRRSNNKRARKIYSFNKSTYYLGN